MGCTISAKLHINCINLTGIVLYTGCIIVSAFANSIYIIPCSIGLFLYLYNLFSEDNVHYNDNITPPTSVFKIIKNK